MEIMKFVLCAGAAVGVSWMIGSAARDYHYNAGVLAAFESLEIYSRDLDNYAAAARVESLFRNASNPKLFKWRLILELVSSCALGVCVGGYFASLL